MKRTLVALVVLGGLVGAYLWVESIPEKGAPKIRWSPIPHIARDKVHKIELTKEGTKVVLQREGTGTGDEERFRVIEPVDYPADKGATKTLLDKAEKFQFGDTVTDLADKHAEFEVDDAKGVHVVFWEKDKTDKPMADFYVGAIREGYTMLRPNGRNEVVQIVGAVKSIFGRDLKGWRDKSMLDFKREDVERIEVVGPAGKYALAAEASKEAAGDEHKSAKVTWKLQSASLAVDALDSEVPDGIVTSMYGLKGADFADGVDAKEAGLAPAVWTITVHLKGGAQHSLLLGHKKDGEDFYAKLPDKPQVFVLKKYTYDRLARKPIDLRDKTVTTFKDEDVSEIEIVKEGTRWSLRRENGSWATSSKVTLDENKVKSTVGALAGLKATGFSEIRDPGRTGLSRPAGTVTVRLKDRSRVTLRVGKEAEDNEVYLVREGRPDVFLLKKYTTERFLKKPEDLEKKPGEPSPPGMHPGMPPGMPPGMR